MYLSRLRLDPMNRQTMRAMAEPKLFHGAIERGFAGERQRTLWRLDRMGSDWYLLVISPEMPDLADAAKQFGFPNDENMCECRDYEPLLNRITNGSRWHFRLVANPVYHTPGNIALGKRGKVIAHATPEHQQNWLKRKSAEHGFCLEDGEFLAVGEQWYRFGKGADKKLVSLLAVTFEGALTVIDRDAFKKMLTEGLGRGKAYGMGMLTIAREREN